MYPKRRGIAEVEHTRLGPTYLSLSLFLQAPVDFESVRQTGLNRTLTTGQLCPATFQWTHEFSFTHHRAPLPEGKIAPTSSAQNSSRVSPGLPTQRRQVQRLLLDALRHLHFKQNFCLSTNNCWLGYLTRDGGSKTKLDSAASVRIPELSSYWARCRTRGARFSDQLRCELGSVWPSGL